MIGQRKTGGQAPAEQVLLAVTAWRGGLHEARSARLEALTKRPFSDEQQELFKQAKELRSDAMKAFREVQRLGDQYASGRKR